jgi:hypothetical protein
VSVKKKTPSGSRVKNEKGKVGSIERHTKLVELSQPFN